jgi:phage shock protein A
MHRSRPRDARTARLVERIVASKLAFANASAEERVLARRHQRALRSLTAMRYRAKAARDAGDTKRALLADARIRRQEALVATRRSTWERAKDRLWMRKVAFRDTGERLVGPPEPVPPIVMLEITTKHAHARSLLDEIEALLRTTWELHEAEGPGSTGGEFDRKVRRALLTAENSLLDGKRCLSRAIADEQSLAKRHGRRAAEADEWRAISADATAHGDQRQAAILAPMISRMEKEAAAVEQCWAAQRDVVLDIQSRIATLIELVAEAKQRRPILSADRSLAIARTAVAAARANANGARAKASFVKAKKCVAIVMADVTRLARCLEDAKARSAVTDAIEKRLLAQQQAKDELLGALRPLAYLNSPPN